MGGNRTGGIAAPGVPALTLDRYSIKDSHRGLLSAGADARALLLQRPLVNRFNALISRKTLLFPRVKEKNRRVRLYERTIQTLLD